MRYVAAYLLLTLGGTENPSEKDITAFFKSIGVDAEATNIKKVVGELAGKDIDEVLAAGRAKISSVPSGAPAAGGAPAGGAPAAEEKKEEKKKEESESEDDDDMGFGLFD